MIVLLDTGPGMWDQAVEDLGDSIEIGQLLTPLTGYSDRGLIYGIDNGAFAGFNPRAFRRLLERQRQFRDRCKFVAAPDVISPVRDADGNVVDVVGNARRTLEVFDHWLPFLDGWPLALVAQDGQEDLPIPWNWLSAIFVGGSTAFKLSKHVEDIIKAAKAMEKWVHVGRVNTRERFERFSALGVDSIDGTGISRYSHMRRSMSEPGLFGGLESVLEGVQG